MVYPHLIKDLDLFLPELLGYWAVHSVLLTDLDSKKEKIDKLSKELTDSEGKMDHDKIKDTEF